jgi:hypothetical protein
VSLPLPPCRNGRRQLQMFASKQQVIMVSALNDTEMGAGVAWRKKPRQFAPKSKLGKSETGVAHDEAATPSLKPLLNSPLTFAYCCTMRRVKCDLTWPSCLKCKCTGRLFDGYSKLPRLSNTGPESSHHHDPLINRFESRGSNSHSYAAEITFPRHPKKATQNSISSICRISGLLWSCH